MNLSTIRASLLRTRPDNRRAPDRCWREGCRGHVRLGIHGELACSVCGEVYRTQRWREEEEE